MWREMGFGVAGATAGADVCRLFQERTDVFQRFAASRSGVLLCTVGVGTARSPTPLAL